MRALVLSGGGSRGQYHVGVLKNLYKTRKLQHDIISGVSVGALIGSYIAQWPKGQEELAVDALANLFTNLRTENVHKAWPFGVLSGVLNKRSFRNSSPLRDMVKKHIDPVRIAGSGKKLRVGVTLLQPKNLKTEIATNYEVFTEKSANMREVIMASSALAPFLEPVDLAGQLAIDGAIQAITPIRAAIDAGATVIDMVVCYPPYLTYTRKDQLNAIGIGLHVIDLLIQKLTWVDIDQTRRINELAQKLGGTSKRYVELNVISPKQDLIVNSLNFIPSEAKQLQALGYEDAKAALFGA